MTTALILGFALSAISAGTVMVQGLRRRREVPIYGVDAVMAMGILVCALAGVAHLTTRDGTLVQIYTWLGYAAMTLVVATLYCVARALADRSWRLDRKTLLLLCIEPIIMIILMIVNPGGLFFTGMNPEGVQGVPVMLAGPLFWVHMAYNYSVLSVAMLLLIRSWLQAPPRVKTQYLLVVLSTIPPCVTNIVGLYLLGRSVDLTVVGLALTMVIVFFLIGRLNLPRQITVGRQQILDNIADSVIVVDSDLIIRDVNVAAERLLTSFTPAAGRPPGFSLTAVLGEQPDLRPDAPERQTITDLRGTGVDLDLRFSVLRDRRGERIGQVVVASDITVANRLRRAAEEANAGLRRQLEINEALRSDLAEQALRLAEQAVRDELTGLHNRRHLMDVIGRELVRADRHGEPLSFVLIDIDHFKRVNDDHGHEAGDRVLAEMAELLARNARSDDIVVRYGGEEFVVVLPGAGAQAAEQRINALRRRVGATVIDVGGHDVSVTFSAGVATYTGHQTVADLLRAADKALYAAKRLGRDRVVLADAASAADAEPDAGRHRPPARLSPGDDSRSSGPQ